MKSIRIINLTTKKTIYKKALLTTNFKDRFLGLMMKRPPLDFDALVIDKCDAIHTFFMRFDIDVAFLNRDKVVVAVEKRLSPFKISKFVTGAYYVIESVSMDNFENSFSVGDVIDFEEIK